jgi:hypothetical protein
VLPLGFSAPLRATSEFAELEALKHPAKASNLKEAPPAGLDELPPPQHPLAGAKRIIDAHDTPSKKRKKNVPVLLLRASALLTATSEFTELEDLSQLEVPETFSEFAGVHNPSVDDYFGAMQNESRRKQEFSAASRQNRMKQRGETKSPEEIARIAGALKKMRQENKESAKRQRQYLKGSERNKGAVERKFGTQSEVRYG